MTYQVNFMYLKSITLICKVVLILTIFHVSAGEEMSENKKLYEMPQSCDFLAVGNNDSIEYDCSPKLTDRFFSEFKGILINTPKEIIWPDNTSVDDYQKYPNGNNNSPLKFMLSGLANVPDSVLKNKSDEVAYQVVVIAVNQKTAKSYSGKMIQMGDVGEIPGMIPEVNDEPSPEITRKHYFNIDLVENLGVPIAEANYTVYATLGEFKSNVTTVSTKIKK